jgi:hypothetical protein
VAARWANREDWGQWATVDGVVVAGHQTPQWWREEASACVMMMVVVCLLW